MIRSIILNGTPGLGQRTHQFLQLADDFILLFRGAAASALRLPIKSCNILCTANCCTIEPSELFRVQPLPPNWRNDRVGLRWQIANLLYGISLYRRFKQAASELVSAADRLLAKRESSLLRQIGE